MRPSEEVIACGAKSKGKLAVQKKEEGKCASYAAAGLATVTVVIARR